MPEITPTSIQDCMTIARAFERGANHAMTEESVFAVMTPRLSTMKSMAKVTKKQMSDKASDTKNPALLTGDVSDLIKECIPCKFRIDFKGSMTIAQLLDPSGIINAPIAALQAFFTKALSEINNVLDMFRNLDKYIDLCAFKKFFTDFVCIPDLQRILALLAAFLIKLSLEINSVFTLVISLFAPLLLPFLTGLVDQFSKFILAAIKPIECVIDNIQRMLSKLDYQVLFENVSNFNLNDLVGVFPKDDKPHKPVDIKVPFFGHIETIGTVGSKAVTRDPNFNNTGTPLLHKDNSKVAAADNQLKALQEASLHIEGSNQAASDDMRKQITAAKAAKAQAEKERDLSAVGRLNQGITEKFGAMKGALFSLLAMLRRAAAEIEAYVKKLLDELVRIINEFFGGGTSAFQLLADKLQIVQLIALVTAILKAIKTKPKCNDEGQETEALVSQLNLNNKFNIWTDDQQNIHIEEKDDGVQAAIDDVVKAFGAVPPSDLPDDDNRTRQKLNSLVKFTGNNALDSSISRAVDGLTIPQKVKFKCPLQTSVASAEQVNKWIREVNAES